ncbi:GDSL esterase/lipase At4g18970-like [Punica granatum]|uniref:Uncharacterized protein n=2 Tax=Punica granatum TaxID=22663 RepID=A0A2I0KKK9_PUNGR|nr:GDSL esterase/lipase At4g18970-like [Punica granatum]PKI69064.1 hypothetical protein CRG98_010533 [Punica granatum]
MPLNLGIWRIVASALVILFLSPNQRIDGAPVVPCYFIFGNSKNDNRNNNSIDTVVKANFPPFGIDYPDGPTGRFTNGKSMADLIAGVGILEETAKGLGNLATFKDQVNQHKDSISRLVKILGGNKASVMSRLSRCLYHVHLGNNDFRGNYYLPWQFSSSCKYDPGIVCQSSSRNYGQEDKGAVFISVQHAIAE